MDIRSRPHFFFRDAEDFKQFGRFLVHLGIRSCHQPVHHAITHLFKDALGKGFLCFPGGRREDHLQQVFGKTHLVLRTVQHTVHGVVTKGLVQSHYRIGFIDDTDLNSVLDHGDHSFTCASELRFSVLKHLGEIVNDRVGFVPDHIGALLHLIGNRLGNLVSKSFKHLSCFFITERFPHLVDNLNLRFFSDQFPIRQVEGITGFQNSGVLYGNALDRIFQLVIDNFRNLVNAHIVRTGSQDDAQPILDSGQPANRLCQHIGIEHPIENLMERCKELLLAGFNRIINRRSNRSVQIPIFQHFIHLCQRFFPALRDIHVVSLVIFNRVCQIIPRCFEAFIRFRFNRGHGGRDGFLQFIKLFHRFGERGFVHIHQADLDPAHELASSFRLGHSSGHSAHKFLNVLQNLGFLLVQPFGETLGQQPRHFPAEFAHRRIQSILTHPKGFQNLLGIEGVSFPVGRRNQRHAEIDHICRSVLLFLKGCQNRSQLRLQVSHNRFLILQVNPQQDRLQPCFKGSHGSGQGFAYLVEICHRGFNHRSGSFHIEGKHLFDHLLGLRCGQNDVPPIRDNLGVLFVSEQQLQPDHRRSRDQSTKPRRGCGCAKSQQTAEHSKPGNSGIDQMFFGEHFYVFIQNGFQTDRSTEEHQRSTPGFRQDTLNTKLGRGFQGKPGSCPGFQGVLNGGSKCFNAKCAHIGFVDQGFYACKCGQGQRNHRSPCPGFPADQLSRNRPRCRGTHRRSQCVSEQPTYISGVEILICQEPSALQGNGDDRTRGDPTAQRGQPSRQGGSKLPSEDRSPNSPGNTEEGSQVFLDIFDNGLDSVENLVYLASDKTTQEIVGRQVPIPARTGTSTAPATTATTVVGSVDDIQFIETHQVGLQLLNLPASRVSGFTNIVQTASHALDPGIINLREFKPEQGSNRSSNRPDRFCHGNRNRKNGVQDRDKHITEFPRHNRHLCFQHTKLVRRGVQRSRHIAVGGCYLLHDSVVTKLGFFSLCHLVKGFVNSQLEGNRFQPCLTQVITEPTQGFQFTGNTGLKLLHRFLKRQVEEGGQVVAKLCQLLAHDIRPIPGNAEARSEGHEHALISHPLSGVDTYQIANLFGILLRLLGVFAHGSVEQVHILDILIALVNPACNPGTDSPHPVVGNF